MTIPAQHEEHTTNVKNTEYFLRVTTAQPMRLISNFY